MMVRNHGTVVTFTAESEAEKTFLNEEVVTEEWMWSRNGYMLAVDQHFANDLAAGCTVAGFKVREVF